MWYATIHHINLKHRGEPELLTTCDTTGLKQHDPKKVAKITSNEEIERIRKTIII